MSEVISPYCADELHEGCPGQVLNKDCTCECHETAKQMRRVERVLGKGVPITLSDGTETMIRFDMEGTYQLIKEYGSLVKVQKAIDEHLGAVARSEQERDLTAEGLKLLLDLRNASLWHLNMDRFELSDALAHLSWMDLVPLVFEAFSICLGGENTETKTGPKGRSKPKQGRSPSWSSGPSAPLKAVAQTSSSGA